MLVIKEVNTANDFLNLRRTEDTTKDYLYICKYDKRIRVSDNGTLLEFNSNKEYHTGARAIGKWIDDSDIYEKTISIETTPADDEFVYDLSSLDISRITKISGYAAIVKEINNELCTLCVPIPFIDSDTGNKIAVYHNTVNETLNIYTSGYNIYEGAITIEYLKGTPPDYTNSIIAGGADPIVGPEPGPDIPIW